MQDQKRVKIRCLPLNKKKLINLSTENVQFELKLRMRRLMFEGEGDTKYKSVCNSEDFQQRGANFLD